MSETIESFVEKLQKDGIEAGQSEANKLLDSARAEAEKIVAEAKTQAEDITSNARAEAEKSVKQGKDELQLACRDTLLSLHEAVMRSISAVLEQAAQTQLEDKEFLANLVHEVVVQYAGKDARGDRPVEIKVSDGMLDAVSAWAASEASGADSNVAIAAGMKSAGFEYASSGGTVEVTAESVANVLSGLVSPRLREMIIQAGEKPKN